MSRSIIFLLQFFAAVALLSLHAFAAVIGPFTFASDSDYDNGNPPANPAPNGVFRDFIGAANINRGSDNFTEPSPGPFSLTALNFNTGVSGTGTNGATLYDVDPTNATPTTFTGTIRLSTDLVQFGTNNNRPGVIALFNEGAGQKGLALAISEAGNTDNLILYNIDQTAIPSGSGVSSVSLMGNPIADDVWYRLTMDVAFPSGPFTSGTSISVTGKVFAHSDPSAIVGTQIGSTLTYSNTLGALGLNPSGTGQVGLLFGIGGTTSKASFTNTNFEVPAILSASPLSSSLIDFGSLPANSSDSELVTISNLGSTGSVLDVTSAVFGGADPGLFAFDPSFAPAQLIAGGALASEDYGVKFSGSATPGTYTATLAFSTSEGSVSYDLTATVVPEPSGLLLVISGLSLVFCRYRRG